MKEVDVGVYWQARKESAAECAMRLRLHFEALSRVSHNLAKWYVRNDDSLDAVLANVESTAALQELLEAGVNRRDDNKEAIANLGFRISLWNGDSGGWTASTDIGCGAYWRTDTMSNVAAVSIRGTGNEYLGVEQLSDLLQQLIRIWNAETGKVWQSYWWPDPHDDDAQLRERVLVGYGINRPQGASIAEGGLWVDAAQKSYFE